MISESIDKTNFAQSLMHMIKGNLGTGILAMPASFAHTGLINALFGLPALCLIATYCVHLLIRSSDRLKDKSKGFSFKYSSLAKHSISSGPQWARPAARTLGRLVDGTLLVAQLGVCCVYLVFVVDNITSILSSYNLRINKLILFGLVGVAALLLSYIRTLKRLAIASAAANLLQVVGISLILEYLLRDIKNVDLSERDNFRPLNEVALGFGSAMFAFEGISVVLPVYTRMKHSEQMSTFCGVINLAYGCLLFLYFVIGLFGFLKYGHEAGDSITLNLPPEPLYDGVRAMFATSVLLTYPLQFYVPNEIIWNWIRRKCLTSAEQQQGERQIESKHKGHLAEISVSRAVEVVVQPGRAGQQATELTKVNKPQGVEQMSLERERKFDSYEYICRTVLVFFTIVLAVSVPKLNLLMDLIGSITGTALSLIFPAIIHLATYWDELEGMSKVAMVVLDVAIITFGCLCGASGSVFSLVAIMDSFGH